MRNFSLIFDTNRCEQQIEFPRKKHLEAISLLHSLCKCVVNINFTMYNKPRDVNLRSEYDEGILPI